MESLLGFLLLIGWGLVWLAPIWGIVTFILDWGPKGKRLGLAFYNGIMNWILMWIIGWGMIILPMLFGRS